MNPTRLSHSKWYNDIIRLINNGAKATQIHEFLVSKGETFTYVAVAGFVRRYKNEKKDQVTHEQNLIRGLTDLLQKHSDFFESLDKYENELKESFSEQSKNLKPNMKVLATFRMWSILRDILHIKRMELESINKLFEPQESRIIQPTQVNIRDQVIKYAPIVKALVDKHE